MKRKKRIIYRARWEGIVRRTAITICQDNLWRTEPDYDMDDLIQEARLLHWIIKEKYRIRNMRHHMSIFVLSLSRRIINLAYHRTRSRQSGLNLSALFHDGDLSWFASKDASIQEAEVRMLQDDASKGIKRILERLENQGNDLKMLRDGRKRETTDEYFSRLSGGDLPVENARELVESWLTGEKVCSE